jgi:hypothetical protein
MDSLMLADLELNYKFFKKEIMNYVLDAEIPKIVQNALKKINNNIL